MWNHLIFVVTRYGTSFEGKYSITLATWGRPDRFYQPEQVALNERVYFRGPDEILTSANVISKRKYYMYYTQTTIVQL